MIFEKISFRRTTTYLLVTFFFFSSSFFLSAKKEKMNRMSVVSRFFSKQSNKMKISLFHFIKASDTFYKNNLENTIYKNKKFILVTFSTCSLIFLLASVVYVTNIDEEIEKLNEIQDQLYSIEFAALDPNEKTNQIKRFRYLLTNKQVKESIIHHSHEADESEELKNDIVYQYIKRIEASPYENEDND